MKVFVEFGERGAGNRQEVVMPTGRQAGAGSRS